MAKPRTRKERIDFLTDRAIRFFDCYGDELESISQVLKIRLSRLASAYTVENELPREAIGVHSRVKPLASFLRKLEKTNWPMFHYPTDVITDLIGARVICWFVDDCYGMLNSTSRLPSSSASSRGLWKTTSEIRSAPDTDRYTFWQMFLMIV